MKARTIIYDTKHDLFIIDAPCGCYSHPQESLTGHPHCSMPPDDLIRAEEEGLVHRLFLDNRWVWVADFQFLDDDMIVIPVTVV